MKNHGLKDKHIQITDEAMTELVRSYTHEAGVRNLERELANVMRKVARQVAEGRKRKTVIDVKKLHDLLGPTRFEYGELEAEDQTGSAIGLVVTEVGGDVVAIEVTRMEGREDFILTGQLGEVMRESARAGLSWTRANAAELGIHREVFEQNTLHIHVPAGGIPKDGPSAGITMATAIVSALTGIPVRKDVAMTGEITLRGRVLPIGGLKSKILAAHLAGAKIVILPRKNEKDLRDIPDEIRKSIKLVLVDNMDQVLETALRRKPKGLPASATGTTKIVKDVSEPEAELDARPAPGLPAGRSAARGRPGAIGRHQMAGGAPGAPDLQYQDYYAVLGVPKTASQAEIKKAFRKLARQHHPDAQPGDAVSERKFKAINEANEVLSDPDKRKKYDALGKDWAAYDRAGADATPGGGAAGDPFGPGGPFAGYAQGPVAATSATSSGPVGPAPRDSPTSSRCSSVRTGRRRRRAGPRAPAGAPGRRAGPRSRTSSPAWAWPVARPGPRPANGRAAARTAPKAKPVHEATAEITLDEAFHGTTRLVDVDGKRLEITIPPGADTGTRIRLTGRGPGGGDLFVVVKCLPDPRYGPARGRPRSRAPAHAGGGPAGWRGPRRHAEGPGRAQDPAGHPERPDVPAHRPGHAPVQGVRPRRPYAKAKVILPTDLSDEARTAAAALFTLIDQPSPR